MDPKLHALIPLATGVALAFSTGCSKEETADPLAADSLAEDSSAEDSFLAFCEVMANCSEYSPAEVDLNACANYLHESASEGGAACLDAAKQAVQCLADNMTCDDYDYGNLPAECDSLVEAADAACPDYSYSYDY